MILSQLFFGAAPAPSVQQQIGDHGGLQADNNKRNENVPSVLVPYRRLSESNDAVRWKTAFADAPPFQGSPVEHRHAARVAFQRERRRRGTAQHKARQFAGPLSD